MKHGYKFKSSIFRDVIKATKLKDKDKKLILDDLDA
jgi:hypothetical protein